MTRDATWKLCRAKLRACPWDIHVHIAATTAAAAAVDRRRRCDEDDNDDMNHHHHHHHHDNFQFLPRDARSASAVLLS